MISLDLLGAPLIKFYVNKNNVFSCRVIQIIISNFSFFFFLFSRKGETKMMKLN